MLNIDWEDFFRRHPVVPQVDDDYMMEEEEQKPAYWDEDEDE